MGADLSGQGDNVVIFRVVLLNAAPGGLHRVGLQQKGHAAGELALDGAGRGGDAVFDPRLRQQIVEGKPCS